MVPWDERVTYPQWMALLYVRCFGPCDMHAFQVGTMKALLRRELVSSMDGLYEITAKGLRVENDCEIPGVLRKREAA